jgi:FtsH-binding integral membrane protein
MDMAMVYPAGRRIAKLDGNASIAVLACSMSAQEQELINQRNTNLFWMVCAAAGTIAAFYSFAWPQIHPDTAFATRVTWFGSVALGWVYALGIPFILGCVTTRYAQRTIAEQRKLNALKQFASVPRAEIHR